MTRNCTLLAFILLLYGCSTTEPCEENSCFTAPTAVIFEVVDAVTGENLFANGTLKGEDIQLVNQNNKNLEFQLFSENNSNLLYLNIGWETGTHSYRLNLGEDLEIKMSLLSEQNEDNCCSFYVISNFSILNYEFERSTTTGNYKVFLD